MEYQTEILSVLKDERVDCYSVMTTMKIGDYLDIVEKAYPKRGGIEGQREPLKTSTAIRIRKTMISDLKAGTILPPIVLGTVIDINGIDTSDTEYFHKVIDETPSEEISIIDGMQRTTALSELRDDPSVLEREMRVEYWLAKNTNGLIYRMLILNTGQVPWSLRRQVEVIYSFLVKDIKERVSSIQLIEINDSRRRSQPGQFRADEIIELFLVFGDRKEKTDIKAHLSNLSDEFTRLDFIEVTSSQVFTEIFYEILRYLVSFDKAFGKYKTTVENVGRFTNGRDLFSSQPARVGFMLAMALKIFGRLGANKRSKEQQEENLIMIKKNADKLLSKIESMEEEDIEKFLDFTTLNDILSSEVPAKVGDFEREFFLKAFQRLVDDNFEVDSLTTCWRALI